MGFKKKIKLLYKCLICFVCVISAVVLSLLCCCSKNAGSPNSYLQTSAKLLPPHIVSFNTYLEWQAIEYATGYKIYCNGNFVEEVTKTRYETGNINSDCKYEVVAVNEVAESKKSNSVKVSKNCNFNADEILNCRGMLSGEIKIGENIRKVTGVESASSSYLDFIIEERTSDLIFELRGAQFLGSIKTHDGNTSRAAHNFNVIFSVSGECKIKGNNGTDGRSFNTSEYDNKCRDGYDGNGGQTCVAVPTLIVCGTGCLALSGGNGGNGGNGSNAYGLFNTAKPGKGSYGGNGGAALLTEYLILDAIKEDFTLSVSDGKGGKKGVLGASNGNVIGSSSTLVDSSYWYFTDGKDGQTQIGKSVINKGKLLLNGEQQ